MKSKICTHCKQEKLVKEFSKDANRKLGLSFWCKKCMRHAINRSKNKNREKYRDYMQKYMAIYRANLTKGINKDVK